MGSQDLGFAGFTGFTGLKGLSVSGVKGWVEGFLGLGFGVHCRVEIVFVDLLFAMLRFVFIVRVKSGMRWVKLPCGT